MRQRILLGKSLISLIWTFICKVLWTCLPSIFLESLPLKLFGLVHNRSLCWCQEPCEDVFIIVQGLLPLRRPSFHSLQLCRERLQHLQSHTPKPNATLIKKDKKKAVWQLWHEGGGPGIKLCSAGPSSPEVSMQTWAFLHINIFPYFLGPKGETVSWGPLLFRVYLSTCFWVERTSSFSLWLLPLPPVLP